MQDLSATQGDAFFREYTSQDAILKYTRATAGFGISYLLDHDYKQVYLDALRQLPAEFRQRGIRVLEFGCGGGMNLLHLVSVLRQEGIKVLRAVGTDFSPVLIDAAKRESKNYLREEDQQMVEFYVAKNETLIEDLAKATGKSAELENSFHFMIGVNTIRYCHRAKKEVDCARDILRLLAPGGICVAIDMNDRFPAFRSALRNKFRREQNEEECYLPSLEEYASPFATAGFQLLKKEHFCWIPHSAGAAMCRFLRVLAPFLNVTMKSRAMRSLVVARKPSGSDSPSA